MALQLGVFIASLAVLLTAARLLTVSAERVGLALGMSPFAIGVLIVSVGTSLPELVSSIVAVQSGTSEIVSGNVLGANLSNLMLVMGVVAVASRQPIRLGDQYILIDLNFLLGAALMLALSLRDGAIGRVEGAFLLAGYATYVWYLLKEGHTDKDLTVDVPKDERGRALPWTQVALMAASAALLFLAAKYTVSSLREIALAIGVAPAIVAVTILSLGTTLPELVVSGMASRAGKADVAVGNILGSCIFNSLAVAGTAALVGRVRAPAEVLALPLPAFCGGALLFYLLTLDKRISRWEGVLFVLLYGLFVLEVTRLA